MPAGDREPELLTSFLSFANPPQCNGDISTKVITFQDAERTMGSTNDIKQSLCMLKTFPSLIKNEVFDDLWDLIRPLLKALVKQKAPSQILKDAYSDESESNANHSLPQAVLCCSNASHSCAETIIKSISRFVSIYWPHCDDTCLDMTKTNAMILVLDSPSTTDRQCTDLVAKALSHSLPIIGVRDESATKYQTGLKRHRTNALYKNTAKSYINATVTPVMEEVFNDAVVYSPRNLNEFLIKLQDRIAHISHRSNLHNTKHAHKPDLQMQQTLPTPLLAIVGNTYYQTKSNSSDSGALQSTSTSHHTDRQIEIQTKPQVHLPPLSNATSLVSQQNIHRSSSYQDVSTDFSPIAKSPPPLKVNQTQSDPEEERLSRMQAFDNSFLVLKKPGGHPELIRWPMTNTRRDSALISCLDEADEESQVSLPLDVTCPTDLDSESLFSDTEMSEY